MARVGSEEFQWVELADLLSSAFCEGHGEELSML
jgi:hypothetical protein